MAYLEIKYLYGYKKRHLFQRQSKWFLTLCAIAKVDPKHNMCRNDIYCILVCNGLSPVNKEISNSNAICRNDVNVLHGAVILPNQSQNTKENYCRDSIQANISCAKITENIQTYMLSWNQRLSKTEVKNRPKNQIFQMRGLKIPANAKLIPR